METLFQDVRFSLRMLRKNAGFTTIAVLTLALGIGINTAMFGALSAFLFRPFPFREADRLVVVWEKNPKLEGIIAERLPTCLKNYSDWQSESKSFEQLAAYTDVNFTLTGNDKPEQVTAEKASANFFEVVGVRADMGRTFAAGEGTPGRDPEYRQPFLVLQHGTGHNSPVHFRTVKCVCEHECKRNHPSQINITF